MIWGARAQGGDPDKFKEINEAYDVLKDEEKRRIYDEVRGSTSGAFKRVRAGGDQHTHACRGVEASSSAGERPRDSLHTRARTAAFLPRPLSSWR